MPFASLHRLLCWPIAALVASAPVLCLAHTVAEGDQAFVQANTGVQIAAFVYLGAKHMVTGYDHLLFLAGVLFFLYRLREVVLYVTLFALGHSATLVLGVLSGVEANPYLVDAVIGLSVVYKALDNLNAFRLWFGVQPNTRAAVALFGLCHGFGLATKLQELELAREGLLANLIAFNVGVELGQLLALSVIVGLMTVWRTHASFVRQAATANAALLTAGLVLTGYQLMGYVLE